MRHISKRTCKEELYCIVLIIYSKCNNYVDFWKMFYVTTQVENAPSSQHQVRMFRVLEHVLRPYGKNAVSVEP